MTPSVNPNPVGTGNTSYPPPKKSSSLRYMLLGLGLLGGAGGLYWWSQGSSEPAARPASRASDESPRRRSASVEETIEVPDNMPEAPTAPMMPEEKRNTAGPAQDAWNCRGELDIIAVRQFVAQHQSDVRSCYEKRLKNNPQLAGQLLLTVKVGKSGHVEGARAGGSLGDLDVYNCVKKMAASWQLSAPSGGTCAVIKVPFNLLPKT